MFLSELVYEIVKSTIYYENNNSITRQIVREYAYSLTTNATSVEGITIDSDYKRTIDNVFNALNKAIQRVADLDKLALKTIECDLPLDLSEHEEEISYITNIYYKSGSDFIYVPFYANGIDIEFRRELPSSVDKIYVEYYPEIKWFSYEDIAMHYGDEIEVDNDIDLKQVYGITNKTCSYIMLHAKGTLGYDIYGAEANLWINQAESYFLDLQDYAGHTHHFQAKVDTEFKY